MSDSINQLIRKILRESIITESEMLDEERITNPESKFYVKNRQNFIGSHIFGEDIADLGLMYVAYSYGEEYPAYLWYKNKWYHNVDDFILDDGTINEFTKKHMNLMRPTLDTHGLSGMQLKNMIHKFMKKHHVTKLDHTSVEPGEKN